MDKIIENIKIVIFDFDGTLADTRKTIVAAKQDTMKLLGLEVADEAACASTIGLSAEDGFRVQYPELTDEKIDEFVKVYRRIFNEKKDIISPELFPHVFDILELLKQKNIVRTVASSRNRASLNEFLSKMDIERYFSYVLGGEDTAHLKPNPDPVLKTLKELSYEAGQALVVGDMPYDISMGKSAGAYTCGVTYGNSDRESLTGAGTDFVIDDLSELADILKLRGRT